MSSCLVFRDNFYILKIYFGLSSKEVSFQNMDLLNHALRISVNGYNQIFLVVVLVFRLFLSPFLLNCILNYVILNYYLGRFRMKTSSVDFVYYVK